MSFRRISSNCIHVNDRGSQHDSYSVDGCCLRGEIVAGYSCDTDPVTGLSQIGEVVVRKKNQILMGGSLYALEKICNVPSSLTVEYLNTILGIGLSGPAISDRYPRE